MWGRPKLPYVDPDRLAQSPRCAFQAAITADGGTAIDTVVTLATRKTPYRLILLLEFRKTTWAYWARSNSASFIVISPASSCSMLLANFAASDSRPVPKLIPM